MKAITLLASTVGIYLILLPVVAELKQPTTYDDRPMACAAFCQYLARASKDAGDDADSDRYMAKFKFYMIRASQMFSLSGDEGAGTQSHPKLCRHHRGNGDFKARGGAFADSNVQA
ncbi:hypothetical protein J2W42_004186 [Rhizobium tibeticum]|uniref:hypothetical protein n=1 Tax=Rhizobium tibeticum TaxID=501024 RepID=UPI002787E526|nr:hypothetical protein [Rhizobium tibeticum]MDP9811323.1 hypothetical protein [Rhizobium tibeticum]